MSTKLHVSCIPRNAWLKLPAVLLILVLFAGCSLGETNSPAPTLTPATTQIGSQLTTLNLGIPAQALNAPVTGTVPDNQALHVGVTFKVNQAALDQLGKQGSVSTSNGNNAPDLAKELGISNKIYQQIQSYFGIEHANLQLNKTRTHLDIDIKAGAAARLLNTKFVTHKLNNRTYYTPDPAMPPKVPTAIAQNILAVTGLDNYSQPAHRTVASGSGATLKNSNRALYCPAKTDWNGYQVLYPSDIAHAYGIDQFWRRGWRGEGITVNLLEVQDTYSKDDVNTYFSCVGYHGKLDTVTLNGRAPALNANGSESTLDIEMIAGLAPAAHIVDYQGDGLANNAQDYWTITNDLLQRIIDDNAHNTHAGNIVSISMQNNEDDMTQSILNAFDQSFKILTKAEHMTVFVSTGDCGAFDYDEYGKVGVTFPASDTWAVAVGGTTLITDASGNRTSETAWGKDPRASQQKCNNLWGTGGGLSRVNLQPAWQQQNGTQIAGFKNHYSTGYRQLPDVSAVADDHTLVRMSGLWGVSGGTSASAPIWATSQAILNQAMMQTHHEFFYGPSSFYAAAVAAQKSRNERPFYDVARGNNIYYQATSGWDYTTGLGTPYLPGYYTVLSSLQ